MVKRIKKSSRMWLWIASAAAVLVLAGGFGTWWYFNQPTKVTTGGEVGTGGEVSTGGEITYITNGSFQTGTGADTKPSLDGWTTEGTGSFAAYNLGGTPSAGYYGSIFGKAGDTTSPASYKQQIKNLIANHTYQVSVKMFRKATTTDASYTIALMPISGIGGGGELGHGILSAFTSLTTGAMTNVSVTFTPTAAHLTDNQIWLKLQRTPGTGEVGFDEVVITDITSITQAIPTTVTPTFTATATMTAAPATAAKIMIVDATIKIGDFYMPIIGALSGGGSALTPVMYGAQQQPIKAKLLSPAKLQIDVLSSDKSVKNPSANVLLSGDNGIVEYLNGGGTPDSGALQIGRDTTGVIPGTPVWDTTGLFGSVIYTILPVKTGTYKTTVSDRENGGFSFDLYFTIVN